MRRESICALGKTEKFFCFAKRVDANRTDHVGDVHVMKEIFFSSLFFVAIKSEKDYYNRFRTSHVHFSVFSSPPVSCDVFFFCRMARRFLTSSSAQRSLLANLAMMIVFNCFY